jgi:hypothetical protein
MPANITEVARMIGRLRLGVYYAWAGIRHFAMLAPRTQSMAARGVSRSSAAC